VKVKKTAYTSPSTTTVNTSTIARSDTIPIRGTASPNPGASGRGQHLPLAIVPESSGSRSVAVSRNVTASSWSATPRSGTPRPGTPRPATPKFGGGGSDGSKGRLPEGVLGEPLPTCLFVASHTVTGDTRHLLQNLLQFQEGVDEARPVGEDEDHVQGWLFILRHFGDLAELRGFAACLREVSFQEEPLLVGERVDYLHTLPSPGKSPSKRGGKRTGAGRPRGSCRGLPKGGHDGDGSGGVGGAGGVVA